MAELPKETFGMPGLFTGKRGKVIAFGKGKGMQWREASVAYEDHTKKGGGKCH